MTSTSNKSRLAVIFFTVFLFLVGFGVVIPVIPILSRNFGATPLETGLLLSVYSLMQFLFAPFWGRLSDRWDVVRLFCFVCWVKHFLMLFSLKREL